MWSRYETLTDEQKAQRVLRAMANACQSAPTPEFARSALKGLLGSGFELDAPIFPLYRNAPDTPREPSITYLQDLTMAPMDTSIRCMMHAVIEAGADCNALGAPLPEMRASASSPMLNAAKAKDWELCAKMGQSNGLWHPAEGFSPYFVLLRADPNEASVEQEGQNKEAWAKLGMPKKFKGRAEQRQAQAWQVCLKQALGQMKVMPKKERDIALSAGAISLLLGSGRGSPGHLIRCFQVMAKEGLNPMALIELDSGSPSRGRGHAEFDQLDVVPRASLASCAMEMLVSGSPGEWRALRAALPQWRPVMDEAFTPALLAGLRGQRFAPSGAAGPISPTEDEMREVLSLLPVSALAARYALDMPIEQSIGKTEAQHLRLLSFGTACAALIFGREPGVADAARRARLGLMVGTLAQETGALGVAEKAGWIKDLAQGHLFQQCRSAKFVKSFGAPASGLEKYLQSVQESLEKVGVSASDATGVREAALLCVLRAAGDAIATHIPLEEQDEPKALKLLQDPKFLGALCAKSVEMVKAGAASKLAVSSGLSSLVNAELKRKTGARDPSESSQLVSMMQASLFDLMLSPHKPAGSGVEKRSRALRV